MRKTETVLLDEKMLLRVAKNARIHLTDAEIKTFLPQLQDFLNVFATLQEVDVKGIEPSFQPFLIENVTRKDEIKPSLLISTVTKLSPHHQEDYLKGPQVM